MIQHSATRRVVPAQSGWRCSGQAGADSACLSWHSGRWWTGCEERSRIVSEIISFASMLAALWAGDGAQACFLQTAWGEKLHPYIFTFRAGLYGWLLFRDFRTSDSVESWVSFVEVSHRESGASDIMQGVSAHTVWLLQLMDVSLLRIKPSRVGLAWQINFLLAFGNNITSRASLSHQQFGTCIVLHRTRFFTLLWKNYMTIGDVLQFLHGPKLVCALLSQAREALLWLSVAVTECTERCA